MVHAPVTTAASGQRIGVLLVNLGTPEAPTTPAVRRYLAQFLGDRRVVELPRLLWLPLLHGVILRTRPAKSARKYAQIWMPEGSPLLVGTTRVAQYLRGSLGEHLKALGLPPDRIVVEAGMRYGEPSIAAALARLRDAGCTRVLALPLYPQYAGSTTGSAFDAIERALAGERAPPSLRTVHDWHDDAGYVQAVARRIGEHWQRHGRPDRLLLSFHGVPQFTIARGEPYQAHCEGTAARIARELDLAGTQWQLAYQSRFGRAKWLEPNTSTLLAAWPAEGVRRVHVACPGFPVDCLETLEEIAIEGKAAFLRAGGQSFDYIPALNDHPAHIRCLRDLTLRNLEGWLPAPPPS